MRKRSAKLVTWYMITVMFLFGITPGVNAGFSPSEGVTLLQLDRQADVHKIQKFLEVKMVSERLKAFGYTPDEIQGRLSQLNDLQIHQMAQKLDDLNVGGDAGGVIIALLVIAILVLIIYYLMGHQIAVK